MVVNSFGNELIALRCCFPTDYRSNVKRINLSATSTFLLSHNLSSVTMLQLSSDPSNIQQVTQLVDRVTEEYKLSEETHGNLMISLTEAVNNAIIHGNGLDKSKTVDIEMSKRGNRLCVRVSDQGKGFNPQNVPNPTCPEQICQCGGRGVFLIKELCDKVEYADNGATVKMQFKFK